MSDTLRRIVHLVQNGNVRISAHGYDEMAEDGMFAGEVLDGAGTAVVVEDYPEYAKGPRVLIRQFRRKP
jgi:hypothetical protein